MSKSYQDVKAKSRLKHLVYMPTLKMKVTIAIRLGYPRLPNIAPSYTNVRQRFDRMGCYRLLSNRLFEAATF